MAEHVSIKVTFDHQNWISTYSQEIIQLAPNLTANVKVVGHGLLKRITLYQRLMKNEGYVNVITSLFMNNSEANVMTYLSNSCLSS